MKRKNHYLAQSYLKRWTGSDGKLWAYRLLVSDSRVRNWKKVSPKGIAWQNHLYTNAITGAESDHIERWLDADFEAPAQSAIERAVSEDRLSPGDWEKMIKYLAAQHVRTPKRLIEEMSRWDREGSEFIQNSLRKAAAKLEQSANRPRKAQSSRVARSEEQAEANPFPLRISIEDDPTNDDQALIKAEVSIGRALWLSYLDRLLTQTIKALFRHRWTILKPPHGLLWPTSDDPVTFLNFHDIKNYDFGGGWNSPGTDIFLPLSPEHLLYTQVGQKPPPKYDRTSLEIGYRIWHFLIERADRVVLSAQPDDEIVKLRPRVVDREQYESEKRQWREWHSTNRKAEIDHANARARRSVSGEPAASTS